jgi:poly-gamma-glutamate biosynthesis protein PgsC/CapC
VPYDHETFCLATGMLLGMLYYHRTGWACGGIISPGIVAIYIAEPGKLAVSLAAAFVTWGVLEWLVRQFGLYGRQRLASAMLIALALRYPLVSVLGESSLWLGWVVPGLAAADMQRQGLLPTLVAVVAVSLATAMGVQLIQWAVA